MKLGDSATPVPKIKDLDRAKVTMVVTLPDGTTNFTTRNGKRRFPHRVEIAHRNGDPRPPAVGDVEQRVDPAEERSTLATQNDQRGTKQVTEQVTLLPIQSHYAYNATAM